MQKSAEERAGRGGTGGVGAEEPGESVGVCAGRRRGQGDASKGRTRSLPVQSPPPTQINPPHPIPPQPASQHPNPLPTNPNPHPNPTPNPHPNPHTPTPTHPTQATYVRVPPSARAECDARGLVFREGVHGANHALLNVVPLLLLTTNPSDLGTECDNPYDARYRIERLLMYDKHRGGIGLSAAAAPLFPQLLERAYQRVSECGCPYAKGCPQCVQHLDCRNYNAVLCKAGAEVVLRHVLGQEREALRPAAAAAAGPGAAGAVAGAAAAGVEGAAAEAGAS